MNAWRLDGERVRRLLAENGMTDSQLGACIGASAQRVRHLLQGTHSVELLTLRELQRLGERLGIDGRTLVIAPDERPPSPASSTDATKLHAAMTHIHHQATRQQLAGTFEWDLRRTSAALKAMDGLLAGTGQTLHRVGSKAYVLRPRDDVLTNRERERAGRVQLRSRGLDAGTATLLLQLVRANGHLSAQQTSQRLPQRGALLNAGLAQNPLSGGMRIHPDVAFSLGL